MKRFEYFSFSVSYVQSTEKAINDLLNDYGMGGWEIFAMTPAGVGYYRFFAKREKVGW